MTTLIEYLKDMLYNYGSQNTEVLIQPSSFNFVLYHLYLEAQHNNAINYNEQQTTFIFLLAGECHIKIGKTDIDLTKGSGILLEGKTSYQVRNLTEETYLLKFKFKDSFSWKKMAQKVRTATQTERDLVETFYDFLLKSNFFCFKNATTMWQIKAINHMVKEYIVGSAFSTNISQDFIHLIVLDALRKKLFVQPVDERVIFNIATLDGYIDAHLNDITLDAAAAFFGFNRNYFSSLVKEKTGSSFVERVDERRMIEARNLLSKPDISLKDIIKEVGYSSKSFFYKKFGNYYGMTPAMMRKRIFHQTKMSPS